MIRPRSELRPRAGNTSEMADISRKIATKASSCGNICTSRIDSSPNLRPRKRMREKAYAASAERNTAPTAVERPTITVFANHRPYG